LLLQARSHAVEAQLAITTAELQELKLQKQQLEAEMQQSRTTRRELDAYRVWAIRTPCLHSRLKHHSYRSRKQEWLASLQDSERVEVENEPDTVAAVTLGTFLDTTSQLKMSLKGRESHMSSEQLAYLPSQEFAAIWAVRPHPYASS